MFFNSYIAFAVAALCGGMAVFILFWGKRSLPHWAFAAGMSALALEQAAAGMSAQAVLPMELVHWERLRLFVAAFLPGSWLLFSLCFARENYKEFVARWKWAVLAAFASPLLLIALFSDSFFKGTPGLDQSSAWTIALGWSGYAFYLFFLVCQILILMNLELTLRNSTGSKRWRIKLMVLGLGGLFAVHIYTSTQIVLFSSINVAMESINSYAILVAAVLIIFSSLRSGLLNVEIYLSQGVLYNSITVLFVGVYLLSVGVFAKAVSYFGGSQFISIGTFLVFLLLLGLTIILLSDELRQRSKQLINRHFKRPRHDYRKAWEMFTQQTTSLVEVKGLCEAVSKMVSKTFGVPAVTLWLLDESQKHIVLGGSTVFSSIKARDLEVGGNGSSDLLRAMRAQQGPVDLDQPTIDWARRLKQANADYLREARIRYCAPLVAGQQMLGLLTLSERLTKDPFSTEDLDLLKTISDQAAASLLNIKLSEDLIRAKKMEAFQALSAFFVHDLKNLASTLSLTMQNLPAHFDDPDFRNDAMSTMSKSVAKINDMCSSLSLLSKKPELQKTKSDLNALITSTLASLNGAIRASLIQETHPLSELYMDPDEIQKVFLNLILNANEAVGDGGEIRVSTEQRNGWAVFTVSDNGCGMSRDFIDRCLFQPFQTTKKEGLGIGLFQSKAIVEVHQGRIEVESEEGKGTTFRVMLPVEERV